MMKRLFAGALAGVTILGLAACAAPAVQRGAAETGKDRRDDGNRRLRCG